MPAIIRKEPTVFQGGPKSPAISIFADDSSGHGARLTDCSTFILR